MHGHVGQLLRGSGAGDRAAAPTSVTISGSGLDWHDMESYFRPDGIGKYSFVADNEVGVQQARQAVRRGHHDGLQPVPDPSAAEARCSTSTRRSNSDIVRKHGAAPILFMSWAYKDKPEMTAQLAEEYTIAGNANDALVIPPASPSPRRSPGARPRALPAGQAAPEPGGHLPRGGTTYAALENLSSSS